MNSFDTSLSETLQKYNDELEKRFVVREMEIVNNAIEKILREYIDNPITGEITKEALEERNIVRVVYRFQPFKIERDENTIKVSTTYAMFGIQQGNTIIYADGSRHPAPISDEERNRNIDRYRAMLKSVEGKSWEERRDAINRFRCGY